MKRLQLINLVLFQAGWWACVLLGMKAGSVTMPDQLLAMTVLGLGWALLMPVLMRFSMRYDGFSETFALRPSAS
jgi:hypothetical protein